LIVGVEDIRPAAVRFTASRSSSTLPTVGCRQRRWIGIRA
jgi:hypothetical protein